MEKLPADTERKVDPTYVGTALLHVYESSADLTREDICDELGDSEDASELAVNWLFDHDLLRESTHENFQTEFTADGIALLEEAFVYGPEAGFDPLDILTNYIQRRT